ncbi:hypothetical protein [Bilophila sp.]|mgnify:FL=1|uniref:hypothetical protein n=1 Tax=Bilophila sp. TaxID=1929485 RepID=UPI003077D001
MIQNRTTIINTALMRVSAQGINLAFQDTPAAQVAEAAYDRSLEFCLSLYPWPFALRYAVLARSADVPAFGYRYAYPLPSDCMRVLDVRRHGDAGEVPTRAYRHPGPRYSIVGQEIYTDADSLALRYVSNDRNMAVSETFADALAWKIAFEISQYVSQGAANAQNYFQIFEQAIDRAKVEADAQDDPVREEWPSRFLNERWVN